MPWISLFLSVCLLPFTGPLALTSITAGLVGYLYMRRKSHGNARQPFT
jgi:hypothetical protein